MADFTTIQEVIQELPQDAIDALYEAGTDSPELTVRVCRAYAKRYGEDFAWDDLSIMRSRLQLYVQAAIEKIIEEVEAVTAEIVANHEAERTDARSLIVDDLIGREWVGPLSEEDEEGEEEWPWPVTEIVSSTYTGGSIGFDKDRSGLNLCGYRTGKTNGMPKKERERFLSHFFENELPAVVRRACGDEYGEPESEKRLQKMANVIASHCRNFKRNDADKFSQAIRDWEEDLAYLKRNFYDTDSFGWPKT